MAVIAVRRRPATTDKAMVIMTMGTMTMGTMIMNKAVVAMNTGTITRTCREEYETEASSPQDSRQVTWILQCLLEFDSQ